MKKNRTFDKNQIVVTCLLFICMILIFAIFFISNHAVSAEEGRQAGITCLDVKEAYAFLGQDEAVQAVLDKTKPDEPFTYKVYREFLKELHLWDAGNFEDYVDWDALEDQSVSADVLEESRGIVAELFETSVAEQEQHDQLPETAVAPSMPYVDEHTKIRVLLLQNDMPVAKEIRFSANEAFSISWGKKTKTKKKNQVIRAGKLKLKVGQSAVVQSKKGELYLTDQKGNRNTLGYSGSFRITRCKDGYAVVNEVLIEDYLYGVVQSEMPAYFEKEALKAQAVCARTYIVAQLMQEHYPQYDADVDDSVRFQAYNKAALDARVVEAVDDTKGLIIAKDNLPINAYFFSTSHGMTSGTEIWGLPALDYLQPARGNSDRALPDLFDEETFRTYISESDPEDYDASSGYYRWKATLDISSRLSEVKTLLQGIDEAHPEYVIIKDSHGQQTTAAAMNDWKEAQRLKVLERSSSGAVLRLLIAFSEGGVELSNENCIRQVLGVWMGDLRDKDGNSLAANGMLPSVYFYVQPIKEGIVLFGGGLGHGIGMSQYGADGYAKQGADMEEILHFYYQGVELYQLYPGSGN